MLTFLRKHQRFFFLVVTIVTIASFLFFGTAQMSVEEKIVEQDKEIAKALDGSSIREKDIQAMMRFFSCHSCDFVQKDLLATGLGVLVAERYFEEIKDDFKERLDKAKSYRPYAHPQAPSINAEEIRHRFAPEMAERISYVKKSAPTPDSFALFCRLYLDQTVFSPALLQKILLYQQKQYDGIRHDPSLSEERLALFGFKSLEDWVGPKYLEKVSLMVMNAAKIAEQRGYKIAKDEIKTDLVQHVLNLLKTSYPQETLSYTDAQDFLRRELYNRQIDEHVAIKSWKNVMLFRRLFDEVGHGMFLDSLVYNQFASYAGESVTVERYQLPPLLRFQNLRDLFKLQYYINAVSPKTKSKLPLQFYSIDELEKRCPQLVFSKFYLGVSKLNHNDLTERVTLKETWNWQSSEMGWALLVKEFPFLQQAKGDHLTFLDTLDEDLRFSIDSFTRTQIASLHPEWMQDALQKINPEKITVNICLKGAVYPFDDIDNGSKLIDLFHTVPIGESVSFYSPDKKSYYVVTVLEKPTKKEIMTFEESLKGDWIGKLVDKKLEAAYLDVRKKDPSLFQLPNGDWKPFKDVSDEVGKLVYSSEPVTSRLINFMEEAKKDIIKEGSSSAYLTSQGDPLKDQWQLIRCQQDIKRSDKTTFDKGKMFDAAEGEWSAVLSSPEGDVTFFRLLKKTVKTDPITEQINQGQQILSMDARRLLMDQVLTLMEEAQ